MTFVGAIKIVFKRWNDYRGVSSRKEFWYFYLFFVLASLVTSTFDSLIAKGQAGIPLLNLTNVLQVVIFFWLLPLTVRRFHDAGFSGYWLLLMLIPILALALASRAVLLFVDTFQVYSTLPEPTMAQDQMLATRFLNGFGWAMATYLPIQVFHFVITLLKSRSAEQGNRFAGNNSSNQLS